ncbi:MAG: SRPBCC family protein [Thermodesulfobacteriota bacterium]
MPTVIRKVYIKAPPDKVFDLIADVEGFPRFSKYIKEVKEAPKGKYNWRVEFFGMTFRWKADLVKSERPTYFEWRTTEGLYNAGCYTLEPKGDQTLVTFKMEYRLPIRFLDMISSPVMTEVMSTITREILTNVKRELETNL